MLFVNKFAVYANSVLMLLAIFAFAGTFNASYNPGPHAWLLGGFWPTFVAAALIVMSNPISFGAFLGDWSRYIPRNTSQRKLLLATILGQLLTLIPFIFGVATATLVFGKSDYVVALLQVSPIWYALLIIVVAFIGGLSTATTSLYGTGLDFSSVFHRPPTRQRDKVSAVALNDRRSYIELSHPLRSGMQVYPGDPPVNLSTAATIAADGVAVTHLDIGSHSGTHIDAPSHCVAGGRTVQQIDLNEVCGPAQIIPVGPLSPDAQINAQDLEPMIGSAALPPRVLLASGWDRYYGSATYLHHPTIRVEAAQLLWEHGARMFGIDWLNPDTTLTVDDQVATTLPTHDFILGHDGLIIENLRNLTTLTPSDTVDILIMPLLIEGADGAPVRAAATRFRPLDQQESAP
ncbi:cyclase family protein [Microbacterium kribbense]